jgi:hypothetical protein
MSTSLFAKIEGAEKSFAAFAEKELAKAEGEMPEIDKIADAVLTYAGGALQIAVTAEGGPVAGALVGKVVATAQSDLIAVNGLVTDFGATPTAKSLLASVTTNLAPLLAAGGVKSAKATDAVTKALSEINILAAAIPAAVAAA